MSARRLALSVAFALAGLAAVGGSASAALTRATAAKPCLIVAKGPHWTYKGQQGTQYNVLGVNGGSCATGVKWLSRFTHESSAVFKGPSGWSCIGISATAHLGECTLKNGGIVEWSPKLRK
jgi:hypothetical protein